MNLQLTSYAGGQSIHGFERRHIQFIPKKDSKRITDRQERYVQTHVVLFQR